VLDLDDWRECDAYIAGFELFNEGYYWEAHEQWEAVWIAVGRSGVAGSLLKGLIKLAAAGVKIRQGRGDAALSLLDGARADFEAASRSSAQIAGVDVAAILALLPEVSRTACDARADAKLPAQVLFDPLEWANFGPAFRLEQIGSPRSR
jgi:uncharacterized protein